MTEHASQIEPKKNAVYSSMIDKFSTARIQNLDNGTAQPRGGQCNPKLRYVQAKNSLTRVALLEEILRICSNNKLKQVMTPSETPKNMADKLKTPFIKTLKLHSWRLIGRQKQRIDPFTNRSHTSGERADYPGAAALEVPEHLLHRPGVVPWVHSERRFAGFGRCHRYWKRFAASLFLTYIFVWCRRAEEGLKEEREGRRSGREPWERESGLEEARTCPWWWDWDL